MLHYEKVFAPCILPRDSFWRAFRRIAPIGASNRRRVLNRRRVILPRNDHLIPTRLSYHESMIFIGVLGDQEGRGPRGQGARRLGEGEGTKGLDSQGATEPGGQKEQGARGQEMARKGPGSQAPPPIPPPWTGGLAFPRYTEKVVA